MVKRNDFNPECITYSQMNMIFNVRIFYRRLMNLTRSYMRNRYYNLGTEDVLFDRLYLESSDFGKLLHLNFGRAYSEQYSLFSSQFVNDLRDLISAQIAGNTEGINQNVTRLYDNFTKSASLRAAMNPYWSEDEYRNLLETYVQALITEANALSTGNFNEDIALYARLTELTNRLGDVFAEGVYNFITTGANIPAQVSGPCITYEQMRTIQNIRMFWFDFEVWLRSYMISKYLKIGDTEAIYNQLKKVVVDYTNDIKTVYGEKFAADLLRELNDYIDLVNNYTTAQLAGNTDEINRIIPLLYKNADNRAALQASANPFLNENQWRNSLYNLQVRGFINESAAIKSGDIARSLDIYIALLNQAEDMSGYFAQALFNYFTQVQKGQ